MNDNTTTDALFAFDNSYARLPDRFYVRLAPIPVKSPEILAVNHILAAQLGLDPDALVTPEGREILAGNRVPAGADPLALAYAGHQFGNFVPQLGDGRAILLGELISPEKKRFDLQLKGSGRTPFSRGGDGRAPIGPVLREFLVSEAMHCFGIPTTRSLAAVSSGETVLRQKRHPGGVLSRVAASHIRVGTFQYFAVRGDQLGVTMLADHVIDRHYPELEGGEDAYRELLTQVMERQARLVTEWMRVGFIHGVMNTDNCSIAGETIDYGPCAFMDTYHPNTVYSSIDEMGRYAFSNQPHIAHWNMAQFAQTLIPLLATDEEKAYMIAEEALNSFPDLFDRYWLAMMRSKLALATESAEDRELVNDLLSIMRDRELDYTLTFRWLAAALQTNEDQPAFPYVSEDLYSNVLASWLKRWKARLLNEEFPVSESIKMMNRYNPLYIPRNHLVEQALADAENGDMTSFSSLREVLAQPYKEQPGLTTYALPPRPEEVVTATFCGT